MLKIYRVLPFYKGNNGRKKFSKGTIASKVPKTKEKKRKKNPAFLSN